MHKRVKENDIVDTVPAFDALLNNMNTIMNKVAKTDLKPGAHALENGIRERERSRIFSTVKPEPTRSKTK